MKLTIMMKKQTLLMLVLLPLLAGCEKDDSSGSSQDDGTNIKAIVEHFTSQLSHQDNLPESDINLAWTATDNLAVIYPDNYLANKFVIDPNSISQDGTSANFITTETKLTLGKPFLAFYPYEKAPASGDALFSPEGQVQHGNNNFEHLPMYNFMYSGEYYHQSREVHLRHLMAMLSFDIAIPETALKNVSELVISSNNENFLKQRSISGKEQVMEALSLGAMNISASESVPAILHLMVFPSTLMPDDRLMVSLKCSDNSQYRYTKVIEQKTEFVAGKRYLTRFTEVTGVNYQIGADVESLPDNNTTFTIVSYAAGSQVIDEITNGIRPIGTYAYLSNDGRVLQRASVAEEYPYNYVSANNKKGQVLPNGKYNTAIISPAFPLTKYETNHFAVIQREQDIKATAPFETTVLNDDIITTGQDNKLLEVGAAMILGFHAPDDETSFAINNLTLNNAGKRGWFNPITQLTMVDFASVGAPDFASGSTDIIAVNSTPPTPEEPELKYKSNEIALFAKDYSSLTSNKLSLSFGVTYSGGSKDVKFPINRNVVDGYIYAFTFSLNAIDKTLTVTVEVWNRIDVGGSIGTPRNRAFKMNYRSRPIETYTSVIPLG